MELLLGDRGDGASPHENGGMPGGDALWPFTSPFSGNEAQSMEMMSVKEQEITAATARLKEETDYRTIVLEIKTQPEVPPEPRRDGGRGAQ